MSSVYHSSPIVVCGMPRSGTTLIGEFLRRSGVQVFSECAFPSFIALLRDVRSSTEQRWRGIDPDTCDDRISRLVYEIWRSITNDKRFDINAKRYATKTPNAELNAEQFDALFARNKPFYVYCVRNPQSVYSSVLRTAWGYEQSPKYFVNRYKQSLEAALAIQDRVSIIDIDHATGSFDYRCLWAKKLLSSLDLNENEKSANFLKNWPPVNRIFGGNQGELDPVKIEESVAEFGRIFKIQGITDLYRYVLEKTGK